MKERRGIWVVVGCMVAVACLGLNGCRPVQGFECQPISIVNSVVDGTLPPLEPDQVDQITRNAMAGCKLEAAIRPQDCKIRELPGCAQEVEITGFENGMFVVNADGEKVTTPVETIAERTVRIDSAGPTVGGDAVVSQAETQAEGIHLEAGTLLIRGDQVFSQKDPRWKDVRFGPNDVFTLGEHGCWLTTLAAYHSALTGDTFTPADLVEKLKGDGMDGFSVCLLREYDPFECEGQTPIGEYMGWEGGESVDVENMSVPEVVSLVKTGHWIFSEIPGLAEGRSHYGAVVGLTEDGRFILFDPMKGELVSMTKEEWEMANPNGVYWKYGDIIPSR